MSALETRLVHRPGVPGDAVHASSTPIYQTATFVQGAGADWDYSRSGNPTRSVCEAQLAMLEGASHARAFASGMTALAAVLRLVPAGGRIVAGSDLYGGTFRLLHALAEQARYRVDWVDASDEAALDRSLATPVDLVLVESLSNPHLVALNIEELARRAHHADALLAVDNSMLSPVGLRPLELGADLAVQSATKLLCGHADATAGVVATNDARLADRLAFWQNAEGTGLAPFEAWLLLRGMETLPLRVERQKSTTRRLVGWLGRTVAGQLYAPPPDLPGCVVSFRTGSPASAEALLHATELFRPCVSFGSVTSSISRPASMSHASIPVHLRVDHAPAPDLVRLSVGLEAPEDLEADLDRALGASGCLLRQRAPTTARRQASA